MFKLTFVRTSFSGNVCISINTQKYNMKTKTLKYISPVLDVYEMIVEAPIAASLGNAKADGLGVSDATFDDWGTL